MEVLTGFDQGWQLATNALNLGVLTIGILVGTLIGVMSGLRAIHGVAVCLPLAYTLALPVESMLILLLTIYYTSEFGRQKVDIRSPETSIEQVEIRTIQTLSGLSSFFGGLIAVICLILSVFLLKQLALRLGPAEYFVLVIFAFSALSIRAGKYPLRTLISTVIGLMMATIGIDSTTGVLRFTLGEPQLYDGIEFTTVVIGLFVISELFHLLTSTKKNKRPVSKSIKLRTDWPSLLACKWTVLRASLSGFIVGLLPGAGTSIASSFSVQIEKKFLLADSDKYSRRLKETAAEETANSAAVGGAMVPLLALGIPGSGTAAIILGALLLHNITPGPGLFTQHSDMIWALALSMTFGHLLLLLLYWPLTRLSLKMLDIPDWVFAPTLVVLAFVGVFSVNESSLSLLIMLCLGLFAYLLERWHYPLVPLLLGFVLGELMENNLRRALAISGGDIHILHASFISNVFWGLSIFVVFISVVLVRVRTVPVDKQKKSEVE